MGYRAQDSGAPGSKIRTPKILKIRRNDWALDGSMLKTIISYGSITALQQSVQPIGKLMIQSAVNSLGVNVIAAFNAVTRIDDFALTPEQSISHAVTTFTAQNLGAGKEKRIRTGLREGLMLEILYGIFIGLVVFAFKDSVMRLFSSDAESDMVIVEGVKYLSTMSLFYILPGLTNGIQGFMRGMGRMKTTLIATTIQVVLRVIFTFALIAHLGITAISLACATLEDILSQYVRPLSSRLPLRFQDFSPYSPDRWIPSYRGDGGSLPHQVS